jgi:hypothetical protein
MDKCNGCQLDNANVKPCNTIGCKIRYHNKCLIKYVKGEDKNICPGCNNHIIEHKEYDNGGIMIDYINTVLSIFLIIIYPLLISTEISPYNNIHLSYESSFLEEMVMVLCFSIFCLIQFLAFIVLPGSIYFGKLFDNFEKSFNYFFRYNIIKKYINNIFMIIVILTNIIVIKSLKYMGSLWLGMDRDVVSLIAGLSLTFSICMFIVVCIGIVNCFRALHNYIINKNITIQYGINI